MPRWKDVRGVLLGDGWHVPHDGEVQVSWEQWDFYPIPETETKEGCDPVGFCFYETPEQFVNGPYDSILAVRWGPNNCTSYAEDP